MSANAKKIVIIGAGHVGSHCACSLLLNGIAEQIVLIDRDLEKARCQALDLSDCITFAPAESSVRAGDFDDCRDADILIMAAGVPYIKGQTRLDVMDATMKEVRDIAPRIAKSGFSGVLISITNPCDIVADYLDRALALPKGRVFGSGTLLDSSRLRGRLKALTGFDRRSINAFSMGEHGGSQMIPFSLITCGGKPLRELINEKIVPEIDLAALLEYTRMIGMDIMQNKGATEFGIGAAVCDIVKAIAADEGRILPVSARLEGEYGQRGLHAGVPARVGKNGVSEVLELCLTDDELMQLNASCEVIRAHLVR